MDTNPFPAPESHRPGSGGTPDAAATLRQGYAFLRTSLAADVAVALLHVGAEQTLLAVGHGPEPAALLTLQLGTQKTAREFFRHAPPTALELENAIAAVEDELVRLRGVVPAGTRLFTTDAAIRTVALVAGLSAGEILNLSQDATERAFSRLAAVAQGSPAVYEGIPADAGFAATLLILRELLHHLQFAAITVQA